MDSQGRVLYERWLEGDLEPAEMQLRFLALGLYIDQQGPVLDWISPPANSVIGTQPEFVLGYQDAGIGA